MRDSGSKYFAANKTVDSRGRGWNIELQCTLYGVQQHPEVKSKDPDWGIKSTMGEVILNSGIGSHTPFFPLDSASATGPMYFSFCRL